ncbi:hypothetical protein TB2_007374 [Malus domestica]
MFFNTCIIVACSSSLVPFPSDLPDEVGLSNTTYLDGEEDFLVDLSSLTKVKMIRTLYYFGKVYGFSSLTYKIEIRVPLGVPKLCSSGGIFDGDVSWPTSTQLPKRLAPVDIVCRASAYWRAVKEGHSYF